MTSMVVLSGGLDSATALYQTMLHDDAVMAVTVDYGQRHNVELAAAERIALDAGVSWELLDLSSVGARIRGSALTDPAVAVPHAQYDAATMGATVVPLRNAMMVTAAGAILASRGGGDLVLGIHGGDHHLYADCRPAFVAAMQGVIDQSLDRSAVRIVTPFLRMSKADIVRVGYAAGVPFAMTWSCYQGGGVHCGECGTCQERRGAFAEAGVPDPTQYREATSCLVA